MTLFTMGEMTGSAHPPRNGVFARAGLEYAVSFDDQPRSWSTLSRPPARTMAR
jgi:hypothetical protein